MWLQNLGSALEHYWLKMNTPTRVVACLAVGFFIAWLIARW